MEKLCIFIKRRDVPPESRSDFRKPSFSRPRPNHITMPHTPHPSRGRKASASSKAPRKGSAARGNRSSRSDADASSQEGDGLLTLFVGAGIALLVAAVSSGGSRGHGRRREVVRQRTATRAAKTVGSYVEPPQRTAVAALLFHVWGNLKRLVNAIRAHGGIWRGICPGWMWGVAVSA